MAATAASLKIFNCQLMPRYVYHDLSATFHIFDISVRIISMMAAILKVFSSYLLPNRKSDGEETWWQALGQHGDLELLKWISSDIQGGQHGSHLESLQIISDSELLNHSLPVSKMAAIWQSWKLQTTSDSGLLQAI